MQVFTLLISIIKYLFSAIWPSPTTSGHIFLYVFMTVVALSFSVK